MQVLAVAQLNQLFCFADPRNFHNYIIKTRKIQSDEIRTIEADVNLLSIHTQRIAAVR